MTLDKEEYMVLDDELLAKAGVDIVSNNLPEASPRGKGEEGRRGWIERYRTLLLVLSVVLVASASFGLGRLSKIANSRVPLTIEYPEESGRVESATTEAQVVETVKAVTVPAVTTGEQVVGSKNSTKYHYPWCGGAKRIAPENLVTFDSIEVARAAGRTPAANCKGLK